MATLNVPGSFATIAEAIAAASPGDTILVASGYPGGEVVDVTVDDLTFSVPADVPGVTLIAAAGTERIALADGSAIRIVGNAGDNRLTGNAGANELDDGGGGDDVLVGGAGDDLILSSGGSDTLSGGSGRDSFRLDGVDGAGTVDGGSGSDTVFSADLGTYSFSNVETFDTYYGFTTASLAQLAAFADITAGLGAPDTQISISLRGAGGALDFTPLIGGQYSLELRDAGLTSALDVTGSQRDDRLFGTAFDDRLNGGLGNDTLLGGDGSDELDGGGGDDLLVAGAAAAGEVNRVRGGSGSDTASYAGTFTDVYADLRLQLGYAGGVLVDELNSIENLVGGSATNTLVGDDGDNTLSGGESNDYLYGGLGNDTLLGGPLGSEPNQLWGGGGSDTASYVGTAGTVYADIALQAGLIDGVLVDTMDSIENLTGGAGTNTLVGDRGTNVLTGGAGIDYLYGQRGDDTLAGGGAPTGEANQLWGGAGNDTASYAGTTGAVHADLAALAGFVDGVLADQMNSIENLVGGADADLLAGDGKANRLTGGGGGDALWGRGGADVFAYASYADSNLVSGYDTIADFVSGSSTLDLSALGTDAAHVVIQSDAQSTSLYVERVAGAFDAATDLAISFVGAAAITTSDIRF